MVADSAQAMATNIAGSDVDVYLSTRAAQGFNAVQFTLVATPYISNSNANYATVAGIRPFTGAPVTTPNAAYWALMQTYVQKCLDNGLIAILNPYECGGGLPDLAAAGTPACTAFGQHLGNLFKNYPNVMWQLGNDFKVANGADFNVVNSLARGILAADPNHLMAIELYFPESTSFEPTGFGTYAATRMTMNGFYTYGPTYGYAMIAYNGSGTSFAGRAGTNKASPCPTFLLEANYEYENLTGDDGSPLNLRRQAYWSTLAGSSGQIYGNGYVWGFSSTQGKNIALGGGSSRTPVWLNNLASTGEAQLMIWKNFFASIPWHNLAPDQKHAVGTSGYGTPALTGPYSSNNYVTVAANSGIHTAVAYFPLGSLNTLAIALGGFAGTVTAQWFDPTSGLYASIGAFPNAGTRAFTPSGANGTGDPDRVLLLTA